MFLAKSAKSAKKEETGTGGGLEDILGVLGERKSRREVFLAEHAKIAKKREEKKNLSQRAQRSQRRNARMMKAAFSHHEQPINDQRSTIIHSALGVLGVLGEKKQKNLSPRAQRPQRRGKKEGCLAKGAKLAKESLISEQPNNSATQQPATINPHLRHRDIRPPCSPCAPWFYSFPPHTLPTKHTQFTKGKNNQPINDQLLTSPPLGGLGERKSRREAFLAKDAKSAKKEETGTGGGLKDILGVLGVLGERMNGMVLAKGKVRKTLVRL